jgi:hypothetical protein
MSWSPFPAAPRPESADLDPRRDSDRGDGLSGRQVATTVTRPVVKAPYLASA